MKNKKLYIIPIANDEQVIHKSRDMFRDPSVGDILIVDDGSTDNTWGLVKGNKHLKYIQHENQLGYGSAFITGYEYARDLGYDVVVNLPPQLSSIMMDDSTLMDNISYGYDIVNCSRILENYDHSSFREDRVSITAGIAGALNNITDLTLTDPMSGIIAYRVSSLNDMELTDYSHGLLLQLWIQAVHFNLTVIEIPLQKQADFGTELDQYEDPLGLFLSVMETEKYLYQKGEIN